MLLAFPTHFFTQEAITQVQSKLYCTTLPLLVRGLLSPISEGNISMTTYQTLQALPPEQTNSIRLLTGESLPLEELDFTEFFDATPEGLLKTGEMWLFSSGKKTYRSSDLECLSLSEDLIFLLEPVFQTEFEILDFPETPPPTLSSPTSLWSFFGRIWGFFHKARVD